MALPEETYYAAIKAGLSRKWHLRRAKRKATQSLLVHSLNVMSIADSITGILGEFDRDLITILSAAFIHDAAKAKTEAQEVLSNGKGVFLHKDSNVISDGEFASILEEIGVKNDEAVIECIALARAMEESEGITHLTDMLKKSPKNPKLIDIIMLADELAGIRELSDSRSPKLERTLNKLGLHLYYYKVSMVRGILTQILHRAIIKTIKEKGGIPVSYYSYGTLFISKTPIADPTEKEIRGALENEISEYISNIDPIRIGKAIFGRITETVIIAPELLFVSRETIGAFWKYIGDQRFALNPQLPPTGTQREKWMRLIKKKYALEDPQLIEEKFKEVRAILYLTQVMKEVYKLSLKNDEAENLITDSICEDLGLQKSEAMSLIPKLWKVSHITSADDGLSIYHELAASPVLSKLRRTEVVEKLRRVYSKITVSIFDKNLAKARFPISDVAELLVGEIEKPLLISYKDLAKEIFENYAEGKRKAKGGVSCALCSNVPFEEAAASLIGESEIFTNLVEGGTCLGGKNKVKICKLCCYEAKMRSIFLKNPEETIFVFPQVQIGAQVNGVWQQTMEHLLSAQSNGIRALQETEAWADIILRQKLDEKNVEAFKLIVEKSKNWRIGTITRYLEDNYDLESPEEFLDLFGIPNENGGYKSYRELSTAVVEGQIKLPTEIENKLQAYSRDTARFTAKMDAPNYVMLMVSGLRWRRGKIEESDTAYFLRKMFLGAVLARLFLASVTFSNIPFEIKFPTPVAGYLEVPRKIGLTNVYSELEIKEWISLEQLDEVLSRVAALILIEEVLRRETNVGKDALFALSKELPGRILNQYLQASGNLHNRYLVKLINTWTKPDN